MKSLVPKWDTIKKKSDLKSLKLILHVNYQGVEFVNIEQVSITLAMTCVVFYTRKDYETGI